MIRELSNAGVPTAMFAPMIPYVNDHELESLVSAAHEAGAGWGAYILLRLPREVRLLFVKAARPLSRTPAQGDECAGCPS